MTPPGGHHLRLYAADLGRGPDGRWQVLADRTQAPSGLGWALGNRMVLARTFPDFFQDLHVERLPGFFQAFREGLALGSERADPRIGLLTSGPYSSTYVEQAALARYLGLMLVEGDDLVMQDGRLHVRTVAGLKRADALWRRIDADYLDPWSSIPSPGSGCRGGAGGTAQRLPGDDQHAGLGARRVGGALPLSRRPVPAPPRRAPAPVAPEGVVVRRPRRARPCPGEPRQPDSAPGRDAPPGGGRDAILAPSALAANRAAVVDALRDRPFDYVAQEPAPLSTMPGWERARRGSTSCPGPS